MRFQQQKTLREIVPVSGEVGGGSSYIYLPIAACSITLQVYNSWNLQTTENNGKIQNKKIRSDIDITKIGLLFFLKIIGNKFVANSISIGIYFSFIIQSYYMQ